MEKFFLIAILLIIVNIPVYKRIFRLFFKDSEDFYDSVKFSFIPDLYSLFKGNYWEDKSNEAKLSFFMMCCILITGIEFFIVIWIITRFYKI
ncbi:MAG TPA: hypothetical protein VHP38_08895 [Ruminiclostridium sp.]|nr:hypothetical protein [Ruminiclostridium sp.]